MLNTKLSKIVLESSLQVRFGVTPTDVYIDIYGASNTFVRLLIGTTADYKRIAVQTYQNGTLEDLFVISADN